jgi:hypothetical protein
MGNPYSSLESTQYWRSGVADVLPEDMTGIYRKKFSIGIDEMIATAGSCFAQHVATHMRRSGYNILDVEKLPNWVPEHTAKQFGYGIYSGRYGNIYTARQFLQLIRDCFARTARATDVWEKDGRYYDALRPSVEPNGLDSVEEVLVHRRHHLARVRAMFRKVDVLVFTLGLTEAWENLEDGTIYPTAPGVIAGSYDPAKVGFVNFTYADILSDMQEARKILKEVRPDLRFILTVSPVPLTATASSNHVLVATSRSKAILRTVCETMSEECDDVDYFPSYEIITAPNARSANYESNLRSVRPQGVERVMSVFFSQHPGRDAAAPTAPEPVKDRQAREREKIADDAEDVVCEDALLEAFQK